MKATNATLPRLQNQKGNRENQSGALAPSVQCRCCTIMVSFRLPSDTGCTDLTDWRFWEKHGGACPARVDGERPGGSVLSRIHVKTLLASRAFIDLYISAQTRSDHVGSLILKVEFPLNSSLETGVDHPLTVVIPCLRHKPISPSALEDFRILKRRKDTLSFPSLKLPSLLDRTAWLPDIGYPTSFVVRCSLLVG